MVASGPRTCLTVRIASFRIDSAHTYPPIATSGGCDSLAVAASNWVVSSDCRSRRSWLQLMTTVATPATLAQAAAMLAFARLSGGSLRRIQSRPMRMSFRRDEIMSLLQRVASEPASEQRLDQDSCSLCEGWQRGDRLYQTFCIGLKLENGIQLNAGVAVSADEPRWH